MNWIDKVNKIRSLGIDVYSALPTRELYFDNIELSDALSANLRGLSLANMPLRTRSKFFKTKVCEALGYVSPSSFKKCQPRFFNQNFDTYIQKSNNLQIWNEEIDYLRRYVIVKVDNDDIIQAIRIITGEDLAILDTTGTLTQKYQASIGRKIEGVEVFSNYDSIPIENCNRNLSLTSPLATPNKQDTVSIKEIATFLPQLINYEFDYIGALQERNRGGHMHSKLCQTLGYPSSEDNGQFPDIKNQLLEVKLQTSPTIDLGLHSPADTTSAEIIYEGNVIRHCDVRYIIFSATIDDGMATINGIAIGNGADFYSRFPQFGGKTINRKLQIPLPWNFYNQ